MTVRRASSLTVSAGKPVAVGRPIDNAELPDEMAAGRAVVVAVEAVAGPVNERVANRQAIRAAPSAGNERGAS